MRTTSGINPTVIFMPESKYKIKQKRVESRIYLIKIVFFIFQYFSSVDSFLSLKKKVLD